MFNSTNELTGLLETNREDVFSISLDVDPTKPEHQTPNPAYRIWLHQAVHRTLDGIPAPARQEAARTAQRVLAHVAAAPPRGRGLVIFAAPDLWRAYVLPFPLPNHVQYGRPDLMPMLWAMHEYKAYAIVAVYREHARIAVAHLGRATVVDEETLELDTSDWRFKAGRTDTYTRGVGIGVGRGAQADPFDARIDEHLRRFWRRVAAAAAQALADLHVDRVILGGPEEAVTAVRDLLPEQVRRCVIGIVPIPSYASLAEIQERTLPLALADRHRQEARLVADVLDRARAGGGGVTGRVATFDALLLGEVRVLVAARDLEGDVWRCRQCERVSTSPVAACPACGGAVDRVPLQQVLPLLARRHGAGLELVGSPASSQLTDGIGGLLRYLPSQASAEAGVTPPEGGRRLP